MLIFANLPNLATVPSGSPCQSKWSETWVGEKSKELKSKEFLVELLFGILGVKNKIKRLIFIEYWAFKMSKIYKTKK